MTRGTDNSATRRGQPCLFTLHVHLIIVTKYRRRLFTDTRFTAMQLVLAAVCADFGAALVGFNDEDDHVHLLVGYLPTVQVPKLVNSLKGLPTRCLRQRFRMRPHCNRLWPAVVLRCFFL